MIRKLQLGTAPHVAGEQTLRHAAACADRGEKLAHTGEHPGMRVVQLAWQRSDVAVEITREVIARRREFEFSKDLAHDPSVGASRKLDIRKRPVDTEHSAQRDLERSHAGTAGRDESAVNIPEKKMLHVVESVIRLGLSRIDTASIRKPVLLRTERNQ